MNAAKLARIIGPDFPALPPELATELESALRPILVWATRPMRGSRDHLRTLGKRAVALAWAIDPAIFAGAPSERRLAKRLQLRNGHADLAPTVADARRTFGLRNNRSAHAHNFREAPPDKRKTPVRRSETGGEDSTLTLRGNGKASHERTR